ncbi:hypothetical protein AAG570_002725 [Ranatra chinensis]|uniref:Ankyrin repeat domain-containing protein 6 n=1 Tax=Ranatra chinensis TaxID=642074 RepID=A0ABD0YAF7_9HEMI
MLEEELRAAAARGNLNDVTALLKRGAKILPPDSSGRTALHLAAAGGHTQVVESLVHPKFVNSTDGVGRTALQVAAAGGHVDVISVLLKNGANVNLRDNLHGNTALHEASWHGFSRSVALLASQTKAELDTTNCAGFAALHLCCQNGHNQSCRELLLAGANPNVQNNYGDTSLHTSARYGHAGVARILISACCRVSDQNKNGDTSLHIAAAMGRRKMTTILLEAGCDPTIRNKQYETALDIATRKDLNEIIIILKSVKPHKSGKKKKKKSSDNLDLDKQTGGRKSGGGTASGSDKNKGWSPYGCHYYPDFSSFPSPKLDSLPGEPLGKGEQYFLDLAGNICKGPVGVGLTCHCANFLRDMEARLEKNNLELKQKIKLTRCRLEERVERTEGLLAEWLGGGGGKGDNEDSTSCTEDEETEDRQRPRSADGRGRGHQSRTRLANITSSKRHHRAHTNRSQSLDLLHNCDTKQVIELTRLKGSGQVYKI